MTRLDPKAAAVQLTTGPCRLCLQCRKQIATLHGKFIMHGTHTAAGKFAACSGSGTRPSKSEMK